MMLLGLPDIHGHVYVTVRYKNVWKRFLGWTKISLAQYQNLTTRVTCKIERLGSWSNSSSIWIYVHFQFLLHYRFPYILWCVCVCVRWVCEIVWFRRSVFDLYLWKLVITVCVFFWRGSGKIITSAEERNFLKREETGWRPRELWV